MYAASATSCQIPVWAISRVDTQSSTLDDLALRPMLHTPFLSTIVGISDSSSPSEVECGLCCVEILGLSFPAPSTGSGNILEGPVIIPSAMHVRFFDSPCVAPPFL